MNISKIDSNFKIETSCEREGIEFLSCEQKPFSIHGVFRDGENFVRMPKAIASNVSEGVMTLCNHNAGGRIRFCTNSQYVAIVAEYASVGRLSHAALTGTAGFDLYSNNIYKGNFKPPYELTDRLESVIDISKDNATRELTICFPYFSSIKNLYIGLDKNSEIYEAKKYKISKPVVFYGSSITHGACASRPGTTYPELLSREFEFDYVNLGFSGNAKAEDSMAEYLSKLEMSVFVYDYDYNATTPEYLEQTHEKLFLKFREHQPNTPVIMMSIPSYSQGAYMQKRYEIIEKTYKNAIQRGDKNVYIINGRELMSLAKTDGTVDGVHPTDAGFLSMARRVSEEINKNYDKIFR